MPRHILYIVSDIDKAVSFEWIASHFSQAKGFDISFCFLLSSSSATVNFLAEQGIPCHVIRLNGKKSWPSALFLILKLINSRKPDVVHCHLLKASFLGLIAASLARVPVRIFTRHHGSMHHSTHRKGLIWDAICNFLSTSIVSISPATTEILRSWEHVDPKKIVYIPHGFSLDLYSRSSPERIERFKVANHLPDSSFVVGAISRFEHEKGVQDIVKAVSSLLKQGYNIHLLLMNASGSYAGYIYSLLESLPAGSWTCVKFEPDMASVYATMDVLVHVPVGPYVEAFGQVYIESLAAGVPLVCTLSGIASQVIIDKHNGLIVPFCSPDSIAASIKLVIQDESLRTALSTNGPPSVTEAFSLAAMCTRLEQLYLQKPAITADFKH